MLEDIHNRMAQSIDASIKPVTTQIETGFKAISDVQSVSTDLTLQKVQDFRRDTIAHMDYIATEEREAVLRLEDGMNIIQRSQNAYTKDLYAKLDEVSIVQSSSTDFVVKNIQQTGQNTADAIRLQTLEGRMQTSSLHRKVDQLNTSMGALRDSWQDLTGVQADDGVSKSNSDLVHAMRNIMESIWSLLSGIQLLIRDLVILLAPYIATFYRNTIQGLLLYANHFMFEDALIRIKQLPYAQFQHWDIFFRFLTNSFKDSPGYDYVLEGGFLVMNPL
ncbi:uncharacterized protein BP5553_03543 [Venustampulla echinocandica]|uniref:Ubiquitin-like domain-containing protein n=1 Tax=Venustampulla echinocandica TaxID=2656787 RepID=A0A370TUJ7_9HELO|nr:uncharacterized protein BP5553_03543 [Venustampulla echinocandica]RDL39203.1 hypothetical protein BP5553_03543 [Venustampulla echinocandica]